MKDCDRIAAYLESESASQRAAPPADVSRHLESCPNCRELWSFVTDTEGLADGVGPLPDDAADRIHDSLLETLKPVRPLPSRGVLAGLFMVIFIVVSALTVAALGSNAARAMTSLQLLGMLAAILLSAGLAGFWLSGEMAPGEKRTVGVAGICSGALLLLGLTAAVLFPWEMPNNLWAGSFKCFRAGFLLSIPAVAPVAFLISRGYPLSLRSIGAAAGMLAGLVGFLVLHMECTLYTAPHIVVGHLAAPLAGATAGHLFGRLIESMRRMRAVEI